MKEDIAELIKETGRSCGSCSMCCKIPPIDDPELQKPQLTWCQHCKPGKRGGCGIYSSRPQVCADFACLWLMDSRYGDEWKPDKSKIVIRTFDEGEGLICQFMVDPSAQHRWREQPYYATIKQVAFTGLNAAAGLCFKTYVKTGLRSFIILPTKDLEIREDWPLLTFGSPANPWGWDAKQFETMEQAQQFSDTLNREPA